MHLATVPFWRNLRPFMQTARHRIYLYFAIALILAVTLLSLTISPGFAKSKTKPTDIHWIEMKDNHLVYGTDAYGDRIPDFSTAGYEGGGVEIPSVAVRATLDPLPSGDDAPRIQAAIDALAKLPVDSQGFHGALLLHAGTYRIAGTVLLNASGIVLRGDGTDEHGTILVAQGATHTLIHVGGTGDWQHAGPPHPITDDYVPIGASAIAVDDAHDFHVGDRVIVEWAMTASWIHAVGMDSIPPRKDGRAIRQWQPGMALRFDRTIVAVNENKLTLDAALTNGMNRGEGTAVWKYSFLGRIAQCGIENLRADGSAFENSKNFSDPEYITSGDNPKFVGGGYFDSVFVSFDSIENAWMRNVALTHFTGIAKVDQYARAITIDNVNADHVETGETSAPPQAFSVDGQQILVQHCNITGAYSHAWATQARVAGPNVFSYCTAKGTRMDAGPHQRWATGTLYEDLKIDGPIAIRNRGSMGTGHGWAGANNVLWNSEADSYLIESPPVAYNWAFGNKGSVDAPKAGNSPGLIFSTGKPVQPESLYEEQLRERLGQKIVAIPAH